MGQLGLALSMRLKNKELLKLKALSTAALKPDISSWVRFKRCSKSVMVCQPVAHLPLPNQTIRNHPG